MSTSGNGVALGTTALDVESSFHFGIRMVASATRGLAFNSRFMHSATLELQGSLIELLWEETLGASIVARGAFSAVGFHVGRVIERNVLRLAFEDQRFRGRLHLREHEQGAYEQEREQSYSWVTYTHEQNHIPGTGWVGKLPAPAGCKRDHNPRLDRDSPGYCT